jgi:hypothetical protein
MNCFVFMVQLGMALGSSPSADLYGDNPIGVLRASVECNSWILEYQHSSSIPDGPPMNGHLDQRWEERIGIYYKWTWKSK